MFHSKTRRRVVVGLAALAAVLIGFGPTPPALASDSTMEQIHEALLGIQNNISNATMKVKRGTVAVIGSNDDTPGQPTYISQCCDFNIVKINQKLADLNRLAEELEVYYSGQRNRDALNEVGIMRGYISELSQGMSVLARTARRFQSNEALRGMIRPFNRLRSTVESLEKCCPIPARTPGPPVSPSEGESESESAP